MGQCYLTLSGRHIQFIEKQPMFFVGTAGSSDDKVNVSPKGMDSLRVLSPSRLIWLNVTGSGNETAAHLEHNSRMTLMWCAYEGKSLILRAYGQAKAIYPSDLEWDTLLAHFNPLPGMRQIFDVSIELVQTSCGMAVPLMDFQQQRDQLNHWAKEKGAQGISTYWQKKNTSSLDGKGIQTMQQHLKSTAT